MARVAVLDANVLWPQYLRDTLLTAAQFDLYRAHWSERILEELGNSLTREGRATPERVNWLLQEMQRNFPGFTVTGYEYLIASMTNHEKDRHVLAAAVHVGADSIVTFNVKDFPPASRDPYYIDLDTPDEFLTALWQDDANRMARALVRMAGRFKNPPYTVQQLTGEILRRHAPTFAELALASSELEIAVQAERDGVPVPELRLF
jgi:predicted nucleic acid-binding protein